MSKPTLQDLRAAGVSAALAPLLTRLGIFNRDAVVKAENASLALKLAGVTLPHRHERVFKEVERREQVFAEAFKITDQRLGHPRTSALQSVLDDLTAGRFG